MNTATVQHNDFKPQGQDGMRSGLALAALVHVFLIAGLAFGVSWRASEPEGVEAELWAAVPQIAAQRDMAPPEPKPEPRPTPKPEPRPEPKPEPKLAAPDPQIAIEKAKQEKLKKEKEKEKEAKEEKADKAKLDKLEADKRKKEEARKDEQLAAQREANIKRILGEAGATGTTPGKATVTAGPSASWAGRVVARVRPNFIYPDAIQGDPMIEVEVKTSPDGTIVSRKLVKSSGDSRLDEAILRAIDKTEILPRDTDGRVPSPVVIAFTPGRF